MVLENGYLLNKRYRILDILGLGGMGAVYRAVDENLDVIVAIKENSFLTEDYARQFRREAKILAGLRHPNLPRVFDYFVIDQQGQYLVMDYIEGDDLRQIMSHETGISESDALQIGMAICDALIYLHQQDPIITHRDIKPGNIKITPSGEVVLVDFGLVKLLHDKEVTTTAARAMTPGYSPPEQYGDAPTDHRSDIYSLGATLYAALAGFLPEDSLARATGKAHLTSLRKYAPHISHLTATAIEKALKLRFEARWQSASAFKDALSQACKALPQELKKGRNYTSIIPAVDEIENPNGKTSGFTLILQKILKPFSRGVEAPDPMWIIFVILILVLLLMFGISLLWPKNLPKMLASSLEDGQTRTIAAQIDQTRTAAVENLGIGGDEERQFTLTPNPGFNDSLEATPSPTPTGGGTGMLAYVSERSGLPQIWLIDIMTRQSSQLTFSPEGACQPDWAPDGKQIVFVSPCASKRSRYPGSSLFVIDVDSGTLKPLPASLEGDFDPAWSPDGDWIAYTSLIKGQLQLMKIHTEDLEIVKLSDGSYDDMDPAWAPGGDQIAFVRIRSVSQIWLMDADGENPVQFTRSGLIDNSNPVWYPDESIILFSQVLGLGSPSKQLFGMRLEDINEPEEYPIFPSGRLNYIPLMDNVDVSPDGFWLAFDYWYFDVLSDIYVMIFPGGSLVQLTVHPAMDYDPVWHPAP